MTAGYLAQGIGTLVKQKAFSICKVAKDRISQTAGGKLAAAIRASKQRHADHAHAFDDDSLSGKVVYNEGKALAGGFQHIAIAIENVACNQ